MNSGIYTITNIINNKIYIGFSNNFSRRKNYHFDRLRKGIHYNTHLQKAYNKYGENNIVYEILEECDIKYLASQEHYWATILNTHDSKYGYNIKPTHPEGKCFSSKEQITRIANLNKKEISQFTLNGRLVKNWNSTLEASSNLNINPSNISQCLTGRTSTGSGYLWAYKGNSPKIVSKFHEYPIIQSDLNNNIISKWKSIASAAKQLNISSQIIIQCCKKSRKSAGNFHWEYEPIINNINSEKYGKPKVIL